MDADDNGRWMTFNELAAARGISKASASKLVRRRQWRRQTDNHGTVRILVPEAGADGPPDRPTDHSRDNPRDGPSDISRIISSVQEAFALLREQLERERTRADQADARASRAEARIEELQTALEAVREAVRTGGSRLTVPQVIQELLRRSNRALRAWRAH